MKRRDLIKGLTLLPLAGGALAQTAQAAVGPAGAIAKRNLYKELGVRTFINGRGTITFMTDSLMHDRESRTYYRS